MVESISDEELNALMQAMKNRYGLDFTNYEKKSFKRSIVRLMMKHKIGSMLELWSKILKDKQFFLDGIDDLLVNLTELFRNPDAWIMIRDNILDKFKNKSQFKVWHAGCSTGEEVYTMSMVLEDKGMLYKTKSLATDLSDAALNKAKNGIYSLMIMKQYLKPFLEFYPNRKMDDYFTFQEKDAVIKDEYKRHITFKKHNLVQDAVHEKFDIIFCRNVMIYFDETLKINVLNLFNDCLNEGGFLIIGYYDIMPDAGKAIFDTYDVRTRIYKKKINKY
ncbi:protein-glutamate O-methyltransferase CheR [Reichenbachiella agarivorans]|uniref:Protein-glutamate O-methyltransferase CheR n=1 Tax=Reichenbachiella agarivorans TaxID=2979464 RepID=A0ABY6CL25_9BACT|nr:protein-glutamate O-methyltransferase CheR [Reichenbachiella agarivorans]UXP31099.1 protein-glutamate O-methyltransferase CheR [Reichenbachiella agarivorans]